jgi:predicted chitinase
MLAREQITILLRDAKWIILASIAFSTLLYLPDQVLELYRIIYSDQNVLDFFYLHLPVIVIGLSVWFATGQIVAETRSRIAHPTDAFEALAVVLPLLLGALPMIACAGGLLNAIPTRLPTDQEATSLVGAIWEPMEKHFDGLKVLLRSGAAAQVTLAVALAGFGWPTTVRLHGFSARANADYLGRRPGVILALLLILGVTAAFYFMPVALPRLLGSFGVFALFAICIIAFISNFSLLGIRYRFPFTALPCLLAAVFSLDNINDNHAIRRLSSSDPATLKEADTRTAKDQFKAWLETRPDRGNYPDGYPVYIVSAQGGGLYAAYQSAIFLARLQDVCPTFRHHLFAISSVSGGSVGAATFTAALNALDHDLVDMTQAEAAQTRTNAAEKFDPCPAITDFRTGARLPLNSDQPGPLERAIRRAFKQDFLAPLVAATLFTDFTQRFLPWPFPSLDRARSLEYALEGAGAALMKPTTAATVVSTNNAFAHSILDLWRADGSVPALLVNATDAGSGRRLVISPFKLVPPGKPGASLDYTFWDDRLPEQERGRDLRLSTAAFISARFPWVTPAANTVDSRFDPKKTIKLVDGGYVDNSGVETALDLTDAITGEAKDLKAKLNLVVLSGGDFPIRNSFSFGEVMEPIRALLSTRSSRAYVAIDRAGQDFKSYPIVENYSFNKQMLNVQGLTLKKARLDNRFYQLPLGWLLSEATRQIIEGQSGRYWECQPDSNFEQAQVGLAASDCVQLLIYHELNNSAGAVGSQVAISNVLIAEEKQRSKTASDANAIIACYRDRTGQTVNLEQAGNMRAVIDAWRDKNGHDRDELMGYVLGTAAFESSDFRTRRQSLYYTSAEAILRVQSSYWKAAFDGVPLAIVESLYVRNPQALAEKVYGGKNQNGQGNGDAWLYRGRGLAFVTFKENYQREATRLHMPDVVTNPDLILIPEINARTFLNNYVPDGDVAALDNLVKINDWKAARLKVRQVVVGRPLNAVEQDDEEKNSDEVTKKAKVFTMCIANQKAAAN